ncbi:MAG: glycosyltransferase family 9 protein, partial [Flavobacteriales bacterium]
MISEAKPRAPRILIARFSALGDIVTMQPLVTAMRRRFGEDAVLDLVCLSRCAEAAKLLSEVNQVHVVERGTGEVLEALRERNFDYLMDFHGTVRSRSLARSLDVLTFTVDKQAWNRWRLIKGFRSAPVTFFIERCFECLQPFDVQLTSQERWGPDAWGHLNLPDHPDIADLTRGQVVISLGSSHPGKHLSHAVMNAAIQAAQQSSRRVVLVGGHAEQPRAELLAEQHNHVVSRAGQWSLGESASAIQHADAVVSGDTVTMHLAAAVGTP